MMDTLDDSTMSTSTNKDDLHHMLQYEYSFPKTEHIDNTNVFFFLNQFSRENPIDFSEELEYLTREKKMFCKKSICNL